VGINAAAVVVHLQKRRNERPPTLYSGPDP
jgi:hypothetical protein